MTSSNSFDFELSFETGIIHINSPISQAKSTCHIVISSCVVSRENPLARTIDESLLTEGKFELGKVV